jgi:hypothetical protein
MVSDDEPKPVKRDPRTGKLLPGTRGIGRRHKLHRTYLKELIGERGEKAYDAILSIAQGRTTFSALAREPGPNEDAHSVSMIPVVTKCPSIRERLDAWTFLTEQLNGKATVGIEMDVTHTDATSANLDAFTDAELDQFERFLERATPDETDAEVVDVLPALPEGVPEDETEVSASELVELFAVKS